MIPLSRSRSKGRLARSGYLTYAPLLREISAGGYAVYLVKMPLSLAVLGVDKATDVIAAHPEIEFWYIGGHSLGGSMAANYIYNNPTGMEGLKTRYPVKDLDFGASGAYSVYNWELFFHVPITIYVQQQQVAVPARLVVSLPDHNRPFSSTPET